MCQSKSEIKHRAGRTKHFLLVAGVLLMVWLFSWFSKLGAVPASASKPNACCSIFLPIVYNISGQTVFGAEMASITTSGGLDPMVAANSYWVRRNALIWSDVEPTLGARNWSAPSVASLEQELINASGKGLRVILIVRSTPSWAQKVAGSYCGPISAEALGAFGNFMSDLVARYSVPPYNVKYWEIWNEPDVDPSVGSNSIFGCWGDNTNTYFGGGYYAQMLQAVYPKVKAADLQSQVIIGGLLLDCDPRSVCTSGDAAKPPKFLQGILAAGGGPYFDGVAFHAYDYYQGALGNYNFANWASSWNTTGPVVTAKTNFIRSVLASYGVSGKFLMNTETALVCSACSDVSDTSDFGKTKAYYVAQVYAAAVAQGLLANSWYSVLGWQNSGLLNQSDLSPYLAYTAYQFGRNEIRTASFVRNITEYANVTGYVFNRGDRHVWLVWSLDGGSHSISLPSTPLKVWDAVGTDLTSSFPSPSLTVGLNPYYVELP